MREDVLTLTLEGTRGLDALIAGNQSWLPSTTSLMDIPGEGHKTSPVLSSFTWEKEDRLSVTIRYIEAPFCLTLLIGLSEKDLTLHCRVNVNFGPEELLNLNAASIP